MVKRSLFGLALLLGVPQTAHGLSFGDLRVQSGVGQPFAAEVPLRLAPGERLTPEGFTLGAPADYQRARLFRSSVVDRLQVGVSPDGSRLTVRSTVPIDEPFFDLLIKVSQGLGNHVGQFTVLLGPPKEAPPPASRSKVSPPSHRDVRVLPPARLVVAEAPQETRYGPIRKGETLTSVAANVQEGRDLTINQVMVALWRANREAFQADNMHGLKEGAILVLPPAVEMADIDDDQAHDLRQSHLRTWQGRSATAPASAPPSVLERPSEQARLTAELDEARKRLDALAAELNTAREALEQARSSQAGQDDIPAVVATPDGAPTERSKDARVLRAQLAALQKQNQLLAAQLRQQAVKAEGMTLWLGDMVMAGMAIGMVAYLGWRINRRRLLAKAAAAEGRGNVKAAVPPKPIKATKTAKKAKLPVPPPEPERAEPILEDGDDDAAPAAAQPAEGGLSSLNRRGRAAFARLLKLSGRTGMSEEVIPAAIVAGSVAAAAVQIGSRTSAAELLTSEPVGLPAATVGSDRGHPPAPVPAPAPEEPTLELSAPVGELSDSPGEGLALELPAPVGELSESLGESLPVVGDELLPPAPDEGLPMVGDELLPEVPGDGVPDLDMEALPEVVDDGVPDLSEGLPPEEDSVPAAPAVPVTIDSTGLETIPFKGFSVGANENPPDFSQSPVETAPAPEPRMAEPRPASLLTEQGSPGVAFPLLSLDDDASPPARGA